ncbi:MAG: hypothetical protein WA705_21935 [Candidatus Ozemobacteraceae bacterium]
MIRKAVFFLNVACLFALLPVLGAYASEGIPAYPDKETVTHLRTAYKAEQEYDAELQAGNYSKGYVKRLFGSTAQGSLLLAMHDDENLWISHDGGVSWKSCFICQKRKSHSGPVFGKSILDIAEDRMRKILYLATGDGVFRSRDEGRSWKRFSQGLPYENHEFLTPTILKLSLDPDSGDLYGEVSLDGFGIYKTGCDKADWKPIGAGLPESSITGEVSYGSAEKAVFVVQGRAGAIMISGYKASSTGIYKGVPQGSEFHWVHDELPLKRGDFDPVHSLNADPNGGEVYACTFAGLYRKTRDSWVSVLNRSFINSVFFEEGNKKRALAIAAGGCFLLSENAWRPISGGWDQRAIISSACFLNGAIFVGTNEGLFASRDNGSSWGHLKTPVVVPVKGK